MQTNKRRSVLKFLSLGSLTGLLTYSLNRGIRYPGFGWEPKPLPNKFVIGQLSINTQELIRLPSENDQLKFRAYAPEPSITIYNATQTIHIDINNVAPDAILEVDNASFEQRISNINHTVILNPKSTDAIHLKWRLPELESYSFASIGDTGGDKELAWCIQRAHQLKARFLLHLGDFYYADGDYERAIDLFHNAPLPCYIAIGNHDFHNNGRLIDQFCSYIGPLNNQFSIGKIRYINLDTAASFLPVSSGQRGKLIESLIAKKDDYIDSVLFTHRPLIDPQAGRNHDLGNDKERDWLISSLQQANIKTMLAGHIHIFDQRNVEGIRHIIAGQGLAYQDLIFNKDVSYMVIGKVNKNQAIRYDFAKLKMPMKDHCHPRSQAWKDENPELPQVQENQRLCNIADNKKA